MRAPRPCAASARSSSWSRARPLRRFDILLLAHAGVPGVASPAVPCVSCWLVVELLACSPLGCSFLPCDADPSLALSLSAEHSVHASRCVFRFPRAQQQQTAQAAETLKEAQREMELIRVEIRELMLKWKTSLVCESCSLSACCSCWLSSECLGRWSCHAGCCLPLVFFACVVRACLAFQRAFCPRLLPSR